MDATQPLDNVLVSELPSFLRETRRTVNVLADVVGALGYVTGFTLNTAAAYTVLPSDSAVINDATGNVIAVNLPLANSVYLGHQVKIKKIDSSVNIVTVWRQGADLIDTTTSNELTLEGESATYVSDGINKWYKFN
jgi:hypothetical protein